MNFKIHIIYSRRIHFFICGSSSEYSTSSSDTTLYVNRLTNKLNKIESYGPSDKTKPRKSVGHDESSLGYLHSFHIFRFPFALLHLQYQLMQAPRSQGIPTIWYDWGTKISLCSLTCCNWEWNTCCYMQRWKFIKV